MHRQQTLEDGFAQSKSIGKGSPPRLSCHKYATLLPLITANTR